MQLFVGYHMEHEHGPFSGNRFYTNKPLPSVGEIYVISGQRSRAGAPVDFRLEGKFEFNKNIGVESNTQFSDKKISIDLHPISLPPSPILLASQQRFDREWFRNNFASGQGVVELASNEKKQLAALFDDLLPAASDALIDDLVEDLHSIDHDDSISETERLELRKARIGQGKFRKNVIDAWGGNEQCAVTGLAVPDILNASHIIPWSESSNAQRLSGENGLLLCTHLDRLFDRHLISFELRQDPDRLDLVAAPVFKNHFPLLKCVGISSTMVLDLSPIRFSARDTVLRNLRAHLEITQSKIQ